MFKGMKFGERLKIARKFRGLTQTALADKVGMKQPTLHYLEDPKNNASGSEFTPRFARVLGISVDWLADEIGEMIPATYATSDPTLVAILKALEPRADYIKESALQNVINTCKLADQASEPDTPRLIGHRLPPTGVRHDRRSDWVTGGPEADGKKKSGSDE